MGEALFSDRLISVSPTRSRARAAVRPADMPGLLAIGALSGLILAASLMAVGFCFIPG